MKTTTLRALLASMLLPFAAGTARASIAYGSINNFDTVNDTGHECHGFEIELEDCHSTDVTYTYNYNHYGVPNITEDNSVAGHPKCIIRWESKKNADGTWAAYTAIPAGPISPTNGHMFTNPAVNFGGEHFGVGYRVQPTAVLYNWLIDNGAGSLTHGGAVQVSTPAFTYYPAPAGIPAQVQAVIAPPPPPAPEPKEFGKAVWVKEIRTTTHNNREVKLRDLVSDDPDDPDDKNWRNGEPDEVETEWQILQKDYNKVDGGANNEVPAAPEDLDNGDEVVTRRYEFYKYVGPLDNESGEAMGDAVGPDDVHGTGTKIINGVEVDLSTVEVVGEFTGSQMAAVDVDAPVGLIDHVSEGEVNTPYAARTIVIEGALPFACVRDGALPAGMTFDEVTGVLSGTPTASGEFNFKVTATDGLNPDVAKNYVLAIAAVGAALPPASLVDTTVTPAGSGTTTGDGSFDPGSEVTVTATANAGFHFVSWTDDGQVVSNDASYTFVIDVNHSLIANFAADLPQWTITTVAAPAAGGTTAGDGTFDEGSSITVTASANAGYVFVNWTEGGAQVSAATSYTFTASADRDLTANFTTAPIYTVSTSASPVAGGTTSGGGSYASGTSVTVVAAENAGYTFLNWTVSGNVVSSAASYTFTLTANRTLAANFQTAGGLRTITTSSNPSNGGTTSGGGSYADGTSVTVNATPNANYMFKRWQVSGNTVSNAASYTFTVSTDLALVARFARIYPVTTSSNPPAGGTTTVAGSFEDGDDVTVAASANPGYTFVSWTEGGTVVSNSATYDFRANPARTLVANFSGSGPVTWTISTVAQPVDGGSVSGGGSVADGTSTSVNAVPAAGWQFLRWTEGGLEVSTSMSYSFLADAHRSLAAVFVPLAAGVKFDFDTSAIHTAPGAALPLDQMSAGITANFTSPDAEGFTVGNAAVTGYTLTGFGGNYLVPGDGTTVLEIGFDQMLVGSSLRFALTESLALPAHSTVKITAYDTSSGFPVEVGTAEAQGSEIAGDSLAGGSLTFSSELPFNGLRIEILNAAQAGSRFLCDNLSVTPQSIGGGSLLMANPNWNITLTDSGYSDFLLDNTPGFEGREYLSGEWGAAIGYTRANSTKAPRWLEPNFVYPDWSTNSNFTVVMPITLVASNADGLPVAQSILTNGDIEVTIRYEMLDTVTGMPMGVAATSSAGTGDAVKSNRYVLNQAYTIRNISGVTISNLEVFQLLHGLTSQHGVYDNRSYAGRLSAYRYDATLAGVDVSTIGAEGGSASGLEDYISFSASAVPTAFEIGHYGIEGIDDHAAGKPSDGVHLSIEDNWQSAPYNGRLGNDYFAPNDRWIAGAQRYNLGTIADGQSATVDVMLSILTGTTVQVIGGGGAHTGTGSCNGGSSHVGGVDFEIEDVTQDGTFFGEESEADEDELLDRIEDGEFTMPDFEQPGGLTQVWNLSYSGSHNGRIRLTFAYDPALLPPGFDEARITIFHFHDGAWEQLVGIVDPVRHTVTVSTESLSPFILGVSTPNAIPDLKSEPVNANTLRLSWQGDTSGWTLQENTTLDPAGWTNSTAPVTQIGQVFEAAVNSGQHRGFFRLVHP